MRSISWRAHTNSAANKQSPRKITGIPGAGVTSITTPANNKVNPADEEHSADLLNGAEDHRPLRKRLSGGEGGILTQSLLASYHLFSNMHENRMNIADFYDLACFNSFNPPA